jgi:hypothetical protein
VARPVQGGGGGGGDVAGTHLGPPVPYLPSARPSSAPSFVLTSALFCALVRPHFSPLLRPRLPSPRPSSAPSPQPSFVLIRLFPPSCATVLRLCTLVLRVPTRGGLYLCSPTFVRAYINYIVSTYTVIHLTYLRTLRHTQYAVFLH